MTIDPLAVLLAFVAVTALIGAAGVAIGMLLIAPRLARWTERDDDSADRDD